MVPSSPLGRTIQIRVVFSGQKGVGRMPDSAHTVTATCLSQTSVGAVPLAKYSVYTALPGIVVADAGDGAFAGFAADLRGLDAVRDHKARIGKTLVDPVHDFAPDRLVEGGTAVIDTAVL